MKIFTTEEIREIDRYTIEQDKVNGLTLMERAAMAVTYEVESRFRPSKRIVVFAGSGNNGGDALIAARMLYEHGYRPEVILFNVKSSHLSQSCEVCRDRLLQIPGVAFTEVVGTFTPPELGPDDVVIDGLFGTGLRTPVNQGFATLIRFINDSRAFVISIDVPSGLCGEWNCSTPRYNIIKANVTVAFQFERLSFFFEENEPYLGEVKVVDIELSQDAISKTATNFYKIEESDLKGKIKPRNKFANKYKVGTVYLMAGSYGMMGAAILSARGVLRSGAGLLTVHSPHCGFVPMQTMVPEAIFEGDENELVVTSADIRREFSAVAVGPGLGTNEVTIDALDSFLKKVKRPMVIDADALNCIAKRPMLLRSIPKGSVLTPHSGEFDRLFGKHNTQEERLQKAIDVARLHEVTIVLKGHNTMTVRSDGKVYINSTGNAGMATAGSGDVLTGIIASFMAQGYSPDTAAVMGVYVHGLAGDLAAEKMGQVSMLATDIIDNIGCAINRLMDKKKSL